jgi:hypothetical protein
VTHKQGGYLKIIGGVAGTLVAAAILVGFVNGGVDERIDSKITTHEAVFEARQQLMIGAVRQDVAVLSEKVDGIKEDTKDIKETLEQIVSAK